ncbi:MAG: apolipoprotein N-acyltransferase [Pseudomonadales bacterium]
MKSRFALLAAPIAGVLLTLSFAPISFWPTAILSLALLLFCLNDCTPKIAFFRGWLFGLGLFGSGASWVYVSINQFGNAALPLALFLTILWCAGLALLCGFTAALLRTINRKSARGDLLLFAPLWVLGEWLRTWLLTGFPWLFAGYGQIDGPLQAHAPIWGVLGISFVLAFTASVLVNWLSLNLTQKLSGAAIVLISWSLSSWLPADQWTKSTGKSLSVGLVQANIDQNEKWQPAKVPEHIALQRALSEPLWGNDLVLWPEAAVPAMYDRARPLLDLLQQRAVQSNSTFVSGIPYRDKSSGRVYNSVVGLNADTQLYFKRKLVPFGEFMPLESVLRGMVDFFDLPMSNFSAGNSDQAYLRIGNTTASVLICYEAVFLNMVKQSGELPDFLLTISNDTWFGSSFGPLQHLEMARMRALEWGRSMARGTNNGVSALIGPRGEILKQTPQFTQTTLQGEIPILTGTTPYARFGTYPVLALCFLMILAWWTRQKH